MAIIAMAIGHTILKEV